MTTTSARSESLLERALAGALSGAASAVAPPEVLDAAYDVFARLGIQRATMDDVARRAGLSRITLYRRVSTKDALVEQVLLREFQRYVADFLRDVGQAPTVADRVVAGFVSAVRAVAGNPLVAGLLRADPEVAGSVIIGPGGRNHEVVRRFVAGQLRREQQAGHVADGIDIELVAELMVRVSTSFLLTPSELVDVGDDEQLAEVARLFLVPMLESRR